MFKGNTPVRMHAHEQLLLSGFKEVLLKSLLHPGGRLPPLGRTMYHLDQWLSNGGTNTPRGTLEYCQGVL